MHTGKLFQVLLFNINSSIHQVFLSDMNNLHSAVCCPVGKGVRPPPTSVLVMRLNNLLVMLELWGMWITSLLPLLPCPLWLGVVEPEKGPIYGLNRTNCILMLK